MAAILLLRANCLHLPVSRNLATCNGTSCHMSCCIVLKQWELLALMVRGYPVHHRIG